MSCSSAFGGNSSCLSSLPPVNLPPSDGAVIICLRENAIHYSHSNGLTMHLPTTHSHYNQGLAVHAPCTLLPALYPKDIFLFLRSLSPLWNRLIHSIAADEDFLVSALSEVSKSDAFTGGLINILQKSRQQPDKERQKVVLGIHRSDYMLHEEKGQTLQARQVEINTISASFSSLATHMSPFHRFLHERYGLPLPAHAKLPENNAMTVIAKGIAAAHEEYDRQQTGDRKKDRKAEHHDKKRVVLMIVQPNEANATDQRALEYEIWKNHHIPLIRHTLLEVEANAQLNEENELMIGNSVVSVAYFRAGYTPRDFPSDKEWAALWTIERSLAIKCPSVSYHLAGTKKVQQELSLPGVVERWLSAEEASRIRSVFAAFYGFDVSDDKRKEIIASVLNNLDEWVLKPCREGGGNNLWGEDLKKVLEHGTVDEQNAYILMKKINAPTSRTLTLRGGIVNDGACQSELGIFSVYLSDRHPGNVRDKERVLFNEYAGFLVRTKFVGQHEGGVAAGYAHLDSLALI